MASLVFLLGLFCAPFVFDFALCRVDTLLGLGATKGVARRRDGFTYRVKYRPLIRFLVELSTHPFHRDSSSKRLSVGQPRCYRRAPARVNNSYAFGLSYARSDGRY